ncbi:MAG: RES family NAD+ phosphorylase [Candidatus Baltobacteraceae bacterium]
MIEDLKATHFAAALQKAPPLPFQATVTRFAWEIHRASITSTVGAARWGGRWHMEGVRALYASLERETGLAELTHKFAPDEPLKPASMVSLIVSLDGVADFAGTPLQNALGVGLRDLIASEADGGYRIPQHLGALAYGHGLDGILVPSAARDGGHNLVIFVANAQRTPFVVVRNFHHRSH